MTGVGADAGAVGTGAHGDRAGDGGADRVPAAGPDLLPRERRRGWVRLRLLLGTVWALLAVATALGWATQPTGSDLWALYRDVSTGRTSEVALTPGLGLDSEGQAMQTARWTAGGDERTATWQVVRGVDDVYPDDITVTDDDVAAELRARDPGLVVVEDLASEPGPRTDVLSIAFGDRAGLAVLPFLAAWYATLWLLVNGPEPYRATRWAWFWLSAPPLGLLAFVVLSGPTPGLGVRRPVGHRLGGPGAFVLTLVLGAVVVPPWWW